jgi:hypothetical protein
MKVSEIRSGVAEVRELMQNERELFELNQRDGVTTYSAEAFTQVSQNIDTYFAVLRAIEAGLAGRDENAEVPGTNQSTFDRLKEGFRKSHKLLLQTLTGSKAGDA